MGISNDDRKGPYSEDAIMAFRAELRGLKKRCRTLAAEAQELDEELQDIQDKLHEAGGMK